MNAGNLGMQQLYATARYQDFLIEAQRQRVLRCVTANTATGATRFITLRRGLGTALVRIGERLQGAGTVSASETAPVAGALHPAR
jgi:hypothetical protein